MSFDWSAYFNLAQELARKPARSPRKEALLRTAISRAYYAAFIQARNYLRDTEGHLISASSDVFIYVKNEFYNSSDLARKAIGKKLNLLRRYRNKADYDDTLANLPAVTQEALKLAKQIITALNGL